MKKSETHIFLSYSRNDAKMADEIDKYFEGKPNLILHRDMRDIGPWGSIEEFMESIAWMDYVILLVSDSYLKSMNCMRETLEVMRDRAYKDKIFPIVTDPKIYNPYVKAGYVQYWQQEYRKFGSQCREIEVQNLGSLRDDLKKIQEISSRIADFLASITDMNNPEIAAACAAIEAKIREKGS